MNRTVSRYGIIHSRRNQYNRIIGWYRNVHMYTTMGIERWLWNLGTIFSFFLSTNLGTIIFNLKPTVINQLYLTYLIIFTVINMKLDSSNRFFRLISIWVVVCGAWTFVQSYKWKGMSTVKKNSNVDVRNKGDLLIFCSFLLSWS